MPAIDIKNNKGENRTKSSIMTRNVKTLPRSAKSRKSQKKEQNESNEKKNKNNDNKKNIYKEKTIRINEIFNKEKEEINNNSLFNDNRNEKYNNI